MDKAELFEDLIQHPGWKVFKEDIEKLIDQRERRNPHTRLLAKDADEILTKLNEANAFRLAISHPDNFIKAKWESKNKQAANS